MFVEDFERLNKTQKNLFADACNELLANSFIARDKKDNRNLYLFVINFKFMFEEYFSYIQYDLIVDNQLGVIQLLSNTGANQLKLKKEESIYLLLLRIIYHEKMKEISSSDNVVVPITYLNEKYAELEIAKRIYKTEVVNVLRLFKRYNLIDNLGDITVFNNKIVIYPTILYAVKAEDINAIYQNLQALDRADGGM